MFVELLFSKACHQRPNKPMALLPVAEAYPFCLDKITDIGNNLQYCRVCLVHQIHGLCKEWNNCDLLLFLKLRFQWGEVNI